ncbi:MAG: ABC transporter permease [Eubacteriales bacterium]|nr:ABC transporter permease [Eubacteriales bacterium]
MGKYVLRRVGISCITVLTIIVILFCLLKLMPGSPFNNERLTAEQQEVLISKYGLDEPLPKQIVTYVKNMLTGDFGVSYAIQQNYPVAKMIANRYPITIRIGLQAYFLGIILGLLLGIAAALHHNGPVDTVTTVLAMLGNSIPSHVLALGFVYFLAYKARLFPLTFSSNDVFRSTILPTLALSIGPMAMTARFTRNEMIEVMDSEYILLAETKGLGRLRIVGIHGLKNTLVSLITTLGPMVMMLLTGSTVAEEIFAIPGIGSLFINAIQTNDYNVVISLAFIFSVMYIGIILLIDILYGIIDPRIRLAGGHRES